MKARGLQTMKAIGKEDFKIIHVAIPTSQISNRFLLLKR